MMGQFCFPIGVCDPLGKRAQRDAFASGKTGSPSGVRQSETRRDGRFCANIGGKPLGRIAGYGLRAFP